MKKITVCTSILTLLFYVQCFAQTNSALKPDTIQLKKHIITLASDKMEGRETGSEGEKLAADYIASQFKKLGLKPWESTDYRHPFPFNAGSFMSKNNKLVINGITLEPDSDFYALAYSSNGFFDGQILNVGYGIAAPGMDYKNDSLVTDKKIFLMESGYPQGMDPHSILGQYADLRSRIDTAISRGATAIIFINSDSETENPSKKYSTRITPSTIPVVFVREKGATVLKEKKIVNVKGQTEILKNEKTGHNVIGFLDNKALNTIVIGAHYDHLGYGIEGSLYRGEKAIHNGADDNASGTAALFELARLLQQLPYKNNNYVFIAFSGEEMGLLGSNFLLKHLPVPKENINYMINMDMIGRLKLEDPVLIINGTGTSPSWKKAMDATVIEGVKIKTTESGVGPSDHTSFYLKDIPVLHFFSGTHNDYHKPTDDEDKINYAGQQKIIEYMLSVIGKLDGEGKITFSKTMDSENEDAPKFKVTLGVVPDYAFDGEGMRIDGVSDGKPAHKAGLKAGDIVLQIGEHKVADMMGYMKALSRFKKGDTTTIMVKRGQETINSEITF